MAPYFGLGHRLFPSPTSTTSSGGHIERDQVEEVSIDALGKGGAPDSDAPAQRTVGRQAEPSQVGSRADATLQDIDELLGK